eukprot:scaffold1564_cov174-Amphora_coffeaeformis.AAC.17
MSEFGRTFRTNQKKDTGKGSTTQSSPNSDQAKASKESLRQSLFIIHSHPIHAMAQQPCFTVSKKRRFDDSEDITFQDLSTIDAQTYLSRVVAQANRLPEQFTAAAAAAAAESTSSGSKASQHQQHHRSTTTASSSAASLAYLLSPSASLTPPPSEAVLPAAPRAWVDACCADFEQLRAYLQKLKAQLGKERKFPYKLPTLKDRASWHLFCVGESEAQGNVGSYFDDDEDDEEEEGEEPQKNPQIDKADTYVKFAKETTTENEEDEEEWLQNLPPTGYAPDASLLLQMDQVMVRRILSHLAFYSQEGWQMTGNRAAWCYALLARLETPLHREQAVLLYDWLKALTAQRAKGRLTAQTLTSLNIIITLVAIYLEQGGGFSATMQVAASS